MRLISINDLRVGDVVAVSIHDEYGRILVGAGVPIRNRKVISRLKEHKVIGVYIDDAWSADIFVEPIVDDEVVIRTMNSLRTMNLDDVNKSATMIVNKLTDSGQLYDDMHSLKSYDDYTYNHSINVAVCATTLGIGLGYSFERLKNISMGALLHDIGKQKVPIEIINKDGKLTDEEMEIVRRHPEDGYRMLREDDSISSSIREITHQHHENWDGSGYPRRLKGDRIYELAHVVHICDVYDALISKRSYKSAYSTLKTVKILNKGNGTSFMPHLLSEFFKYVPIYTKGMKVRLSDGREALVYENNRGDMLNPKVLTKDKEIIDLRTSYLTIIS